MISSELERRGFALLCGVYLADEIADLVRRLGDALQSDETAGDGSIRADRAVYAARNLVALWPGAVEVWRRPALTAALAAALGPRFGMVRALFFDKPPEQTWALPWHKDLTVAVKNNRLPGDRFCHPTRKAGVPHAEAPVEVLERMLTARVHLDDADDENGALRVVPGSHRTGKRLDLTVSAPVTVVAAAGDVLLMRPLLAHASNRSHPETARHRRVLHFEFAAAMELPDGYEWHRFIPA
jgi:Phytanoyl-CoA dioxygenase (PhyH)